MFQFSEQIQQQFAELQASHKRMKELTAPMDKIFKPLQERHAQLKRASGETNKRLNQVFGEPRHSKRDRDCLDQDINKLLDFYHKKKPQPQGHFMDNLYHHEDIKPDAIFVKKARSPSQAGQNALEQKNMITWDSFIILIKSSLMYTAYKTTQLLLE
ncbi:hypothetical protein O181_004099 [Austropuccinia psidii MF-1]|uniref:Uncharacterized protein n=1 Tax=Austropuccinia psidii MF-1 TaxID=1389203 RepID=A0A9Q3BF78_9BASI|nr:hypothetical protein [Austropuccinia psidii MF-1]